MKKIAFVVLALSLTAMAHASPVESCRRSLMKYDSVPAIMFQMCRSANVHSSRAIDRFTTIYSQTMPAAMLEALLDINSRSEADCAIMMAEKYDGSMSVGFLRQVCL